MDGFAHRGVALAHHLGQVVFLFGAIPGERVTAVVTRVRSRHLFADTVEVLRASPDRVLPACPVFGRCGGCQLQHIAYPRQLALKREVVRAALVTAHLDLEQAVVDEVPAAAAYGYRWRGEFHRAGETGAELGFTERRGYRRLPVASCPIHHPAVNRALPALAAALAEGAADGGDGRAGRSVQTLHLTVGEAGSELLLAPRPDGSAAARIAAAAARRLGDGPRITVESTGQRYRELMVRVYADSFIQVNQGTVAQLYETVVEWLEPLIPAGAHVVDAYSGLGVLACRLAQGGRRVTALEINPTAARLCRLHAELNCVADRVEVRLGPVEQLLPGLPPADAVIVDPPRAGLAPAVSGWLALEGPPTVVYISCEPATLARDCHVLAGLGPYRLRRVRVVDMFPQTAHIETVVLLERG